MRYRVVATLESPMALSVRRATGFSIETQVYLPGTTWRGAIAESYLNSGGKPESAQAGGPDGAKAQSALDAIGTAIAAMADGAK